MIIPKVPKEERCRLYDYDSDSFLDNLTFTDGLSIGIICAFLLSLAIFMSC